MGIDYCFAIFWGKSVIRSYFLRSLYGSNGIYVNFGVTKNVDNISFATDLAMRSKLLKHSEFCSPIYNMAPIIHTL